MIKFHWKEERNDSYIRSNKQAERSVQARSGSEDVSPVMSIWTDMMVYLVHEEYKNGLRGGMNAAASSLLSVISTHNVNPYIHHCMSSLSQKFHTDDTCFRPGMTPLNGALERLKSSASKPPLKAPIQRGPPSYVSFIVDRLLG